MTDKEVLNKYMNIIHNNIHKILKLEKTDDSNIFQLNCLKDKKHIATYNCKTHKISCTCCNYSSDVISLTKELMNLSESNAIKRILVNKLKMKNDEFMDLEEIIEKEPIINKYTKIINDNIPKLLKLSLIEDNLYELPCLKDKNHSCLYDKISNTIYCPICGYKTNLIDFTKESMNLTLEETLYCILVRKLKYNPKTIEDLNKLIQKIKTKKELFYQINQKALEIFKKCFLENTKAQNYVFKERKLSQETIDEFEIGYAPYGNTILKNLSKIYSLEDLYEVGIISKNKETNEYYDTFNNRLMFPIYDINNNLVAFGGRTLGSSSSKYINTKTTLIFSKSNTLYALNKLNKKINYDQIMICEGYMDVVTMYQNGIYNVVGDLGVAITKEHLNLLKKYTKKPIAMLDGDSAGTNAMKRVTEKVGVVETVTLPDNLDPDEFLKIHSANELIDYIYSNSISWNELMLNDLLKDSNKNIFWSFLEKKSF